MPPLLLIKKERTRTIFMEMDSKLALLNAFTRREHAEDEVYIFSVILCDNEVDRDFEKFTISALQGMKELFIGKTGIFDHNAKGANQTARIFAAEVLADSSKRTSDGEVYTCLKADAYMVRTSSNGDLIKEIDGGIKKEVSVSCTAGSRKCSVCGAEIKAKPCTHVKGKSYGGKPCFVLLDDITDAYEWSFVAVPAQKNAGIVKHFAKEATEDIGVSRELLDAMYRETRAEILRLSFLAQPNVSAKSLEGLLERMTLEELYGLKKEFLLNVCGELRPQLAADYEREVGAFKCGRGGVR